MGDDEKATEQAPEPAVPTEPASAHVPHHVVVALAAEAGADPKSVRKRLRGGTVRGAAGERIDRAIVAWVERSR